MILTTRKRTAQKKKKKQFQSKSGKTVKTEFPKGVAIRVSGEIYNTLNKKRETRESWDQFFRRLMNISQRVGDREIRTLAETWLLPSTGQTAPTKALCRGLAVVNAARKGHLGKIEEPRRVRETI